MDDGGRYNRSEHGGRNAARCVHSSNPLTGIQISSFSLMLHVVLALKVPVYLHQLQICAADWTRGAALQSKYLTLLSIPV